MFGINRLVQLRFGRGLALSVSAKFFAIDSFSVGDVTCHVSAGHGFVAKAIRNERHAARPEHAERQVAGAEGGWVGSESVAVLSRKRLKKLKTGREAQARRAASSRSRKRLGRF